MRQKPELLDYFISWAVVLIGGLLIVGAVVASPPQPQLAIAGTILLGAWLISRKMNGPNSP